MSPELIAAIKERIDLGHTKEGIRAELHAAGYDDETVEAAYKAAQVHLEIGNQTAPGLLEPVSLKDTVVNQAKILPDGLTLFNNGLAFLFRRLDLWLLLGLPFSILAIFTFVSGNPSESGEIAFSGILSLVMLLVYLYSWAAVLHIVVTSTERNVSLSDAFSWARGNISGLIWVNILTGLVVLGGLVPLIIPGIILFFYVYLSQYVYMKEGVRGVAALLRSRDLVRGNTWQLVVRLATLAVILILVFVGIGAAFDLVAGLMSESPGNDFILELLLQFLGAGASIIGAHAGMELYRNLAVDQVTSAPAVQSFGRGKYMTLAWWGFLVPILGIVISVILASLNDARLQDQDAVERQEAMSAKARAIELRTSGEINLEVPSE